MNKCKLWTQNYHTSILGPESTGFSLYMIKKLSQDPEGHSLIDILILLSWGKEELHRGEVSDINVVNDLSACNANVTSSFRDSLYIIYTSIVYSHPNSNHQTIVYIHFSLKNIYDWLFIGKLCFSQFSLSHLRSFLTFLSLLFSSHTSEPQLYYTYVLLCGFQMHYTFDPHCSPLEP